MEIQDNTNWETNPCIWIEDGDIDINIEKDIVEIEWDFEGAYEGGSGRMEIARIKLIELLLKMDEKTESNAPPTVLEYAKEKLAIAKKMVEEDDGTDHNHRSFLNGSLDAYENIVSNLENNQIKT